MMSVKSGLGVMGVAGQARLQTSTMQSASDKSAIAKNEALRSEGRAKDDATYTDRSFLTKAKESVLLHMYETNGANPQVVKNILKNDYLTVQKKSDQ